MLTLEDQFTKALTEMDTDSKLTLHMTNGKEMIIVHTDLLSIGAESLKIIRRLSERTSRGKVRIIPYNKIDYITYTINSDTYEVYRQKTLPASEVNEDNIPTEDTPITETQQGNITFTITNNSNEPLNNANIILSNENNTYTGTTTENGELTMLDIEYGTYSLTCTCDGYTTLNEEITVDTNSTNVTYELTKQYTVTGPTLQEEEGEW